MFVTLINLDDAKFLGAIEDMVSNSNFLLIKPTKYLLFSKDEKALTCMLTIYISAPKNEMIDNIIYSLNNYFKLDQVYEDNASVYYYSKDIVCKLNNPLKLDILPGLHKLGDRYDLE